MAGGWWASLQPTVLYPLKAIDPSDYTLHLSVLSPEQTHLDGELERKLQEFILIIDNNLLKLVHSVHETRDIGMLDQMT